MGQDSAPSIWTWTWLSLNPGLRRCEPPSCSQLRSLARSWHWQWDSGDRHCEWQCRARPGESGRARDWRWQQHWGTSPPLGPCTAQQPPPPSWVAGERSRTWPGPSPTLTPARRGCCTAPTLRPSPEKENSEEVSSFLLELLPQLTQLYLFAFAISLQWESTLSRPARTSACSGQHWRRSDLRSWDQRMLLVPPPSTYTCSQRAGQGRRE